MFQPRWAVGLPYVLSYVEGRPGSGIRCPAGEAPVGGAPGQKTARAGGELRPCLPFSSAVAGEPGEACALPSRAAPEAFMVRAPTLLGSL